MRPACLCCRAQHDPEEAEASALALVVVLVLLTATAAEGDRPGELAEAGRAGAHGVIVGLCAHHRQAIEATRVPTSEGRAARITILTPKGAPS